MSPEALLPSNVVTGSTKTETAAQSTWEVGRALRKDGRLDEAVRVLRRASPDELQDYRLHQELGIALSELNRQEEAIGSFLAALQLDPSRGEICNNIGEAFYSRGLFKPAVDWFNQARETNPAVAPPYYAYGRSLAAIGCIRLASENFENWTRAEPDNPIARHLATALLGGQDATRASQEYVCALFDSFATRFDGMLARLQYRGPQILLSALQEVAGKPTAGWDVLDVGCGTGLVGAALKPLTAKLVGVDLSAGMLQQARERGIYDELVESDLIDYLSATPNRFDVVTASDVLTYLGDLSQFFQFGAAVLRPGGLIAVVAEALGGDAKEQTYRLNPTGRFSHTPQYLRCLIEGAGLSIACLQEVVMREEGNRPVPSLVAIGRSAPFPDLSPSPDGSRARSR